MNLAELIRRRIDPIGGIELTIAPREPVRSPPAFDEQAEESTNLKEEGLEPQR